MSPSDLPARGSDELIEDYAGNPFIRALARLVPGGSSVDVLVLHRAEQIRKQRLRIFFNQLASGSIRLSEELLESNDFLHCFASTIQAALRARRSQKIAIFANLLRAEITAPAPDLDEFEELVGIVDELSHREWQALTLLETYQGTAIASGESPLARINSVWSDFASALEKQLGVPRSETSAFMDRVARSGLYQPVMGSFWDYQGGLGTLSPRYFRLRSFLEAGERA